MGADRRPSLAEQARSAPFASLQAVTGLNPPQGLLRIARRGKFALGNKIPAPAPAASKFHHRSRVYRRVYDARTAGNRYTDQDRAHHLFVPTCSLLALFAQPCRCSHQSCRVHPQHCASQTIKKKHAFTDVTAATVVGHQTALREFTRLSPPLVRISGHSRDPVYKTAGQLMPSEASPNSLRLHTCFAFL